VSAGAAADRPDARAVLASLMQLEREIVELRYTQRLDATERVREALRRLADAGPAPLEILERAAAELGGCTPFDRVLVSRMHGAALEPVAIWAGEPAPSAAAAAPVGRPLATTTPLEPGSIEAEVATSGRTVLVDPARGGAPVAATQVARALGGRPFVLGAVRLRDEVVALVHAGLDPVRRELGELDRELVDLFVAGLEGVLERAALEHALARHRGALAAASRFLEWRLRAAAEPAAPAAANSAVPAAGSDAERQDPLTARELEVLSLLAQGETNRGVARALRISEGTVKYHVKNILRKLRARSRADAVARHLRAVGRAPDPGP
jgi:DNA-binding CsgD family transcriptional regulator